PDGPALLSHHHAGALFGLGKTQRGAAQATRALELLGVPMPVRPRAVSIMLARQLVEQVARLIVGGGRVAAPADEPLAVARAEAAVRLEQCNIAAHRSQPEVIMSVLLAANLADRAGRRGPKANPYGVLGTTAGLVGLDRLARRYFERSRADA